MNLSNGYTLKNAYIILRILKKRTIKFKLKLSLTKFTRFGTYSANKLGWCSPRFEASFRVQGEKKLSVGLIKEGFFLQIKKST